MDDPKVFFCRISIEPYLSWSSVSDSGMTFNGSWINLTGAICPILHTVHCTVCKLLCEPITWIRGHLLLSLSAGDVMITPHTSPLLFKGFPAFSPLGRKMYEQITTPPFHFDNLPTQVPKPLYCLQDSESAILIAHLFGGLAPSDPFISKNLKKKWFFCLSPFWNLNCEILKVNSLQSFRSFWDMIWKYMPFISLGKKLMKIKVSFQSIQKRCFFQSVLFSNDFNKMFQFELHLHIGEILF